MAPRSALERLLLRKGVGLLTAERDQCADCGRTPLFGEHVHRYDRGILVCDLCRPRRRQAPETEEVVHHCEHDRTVQRVAA
jgi:ribosomal protein L37AE/L43A